MSKQRTKPATPSTIADRVKARMVILNVSQAQLARNAGVTRMAINCLCNGVTRNPSNFLFELADALDCDARWLLKGITEDEARKARTEGKA